LPQSASQRYLQIARTLAEPSVEPRPTELRAETAVDVVDQTLSANELATWLWNPIAAFVEKVLRARFRGPELYEPTQALTEIGPLQTSKVGNGALRAGLRGDALEAYLAAAPEFPDGNWGGLARHRIGREILTVSGRTDALIGKREVRSELVAARFDEVLLEERIDGLCLDARILKRFTKRGKRIELAAWIEHLLMQTSERLPRTTHLVLRGSEAHATVVSFSPVEDPQARLQELIELYRASRDAPVPLLEECSRIFAEALENGDVSAAIAAARAQLKKQRGWDPYLRYALGPEDPFLDASWSEAFQGAASQVYEPLLRHRSEG